jgi:hypothetical protein
MPRLVLRKAVKRFTEMTEGGWVSCRWDKLRGQMMNKTAPIRGVWHGRAYRMNFEDHPALGDDDVVMVLAELDSSGEVARQTRCAVPRRAGTRYQKLRDNELIETLLHEFVMDTSDTA